MEQILEPCIGTLGKRSKHSLNNVAQKVLDSNTYEEEGPASLATSVTGFHQCRVSNLSSLESPRTLLRMKNQEHIRHRAFEPLLV